jgi:hypothetical protein
MDFQITIRTKDSDNSIRILRAALKLLLRKFGLRVIAVKQCPQASKPTITAAVSEPE